MARVVTVLGWALLIAGAGLIAIGLAGVALTDGVWAAVQMLNPFTHIVNFFIMALTLAPGLGLISWGQKLEEGNRGPD